MKCTNMLKDYLDGQKSSRVISGDAQSHPGEMDGKLTVKSAWNPDLLWKESWKDLIIN